MLTAVKEELDTIKKQQKDGLSRKRQAAASEAARPLFEDAEDDSQLAATQTQHGRQLHFQGGLIGTMQDQTIKLDMGKVRVG